MLVLCSVYDSAVGAYGRPFFARAKGEALRAFADEVGNPSSEFGKHPEDYSLVYLGAFDELRGEFALADKPDVLLYGRDVGSKE